MPLRIAFDLDGVFADLGTALGREAQRLGLLPGPGMAAPSEPAPDNPSPQARSDEHHTTVEATLSHLRLSSRKQKVLWREVQKIENFWEGLGELDPGSLRRLHELARTHGWEVVFITTRPATAGDPVQLQSQRWLQRNGFDLPSVLIVPGSRGKLASALQLDVVVDDRPENCLDVATESSARAILVWRNRDPDEQSPGIDKAAARMGIGTVRSVGECLDLLVKSNPSSRPATMLDRLRELLGLVSRGGRRA